MDQPSLLTTTEHSTTELREFTEPVVIKVKITLISMVTIVLLGTFGNNFVEV